MRVHHEARGGRVTERIAVELEPHEAAALTNLYESLFDDGKDDPIATGLRKVAREWAIDSDPTLFTTSAAGQGAIPPCLDADASRTEGSLR